MRRTKDEINEVERRIIALTKKRVLIGVPGDSERKPEKGEPKPPNNAVIAYMMEHGDDAHHLPPRPFLAPGCAAIKDEAVSLLAKAGADALLGDMKGADRALEALGIAGQASVRNQITNGSHAPLSDRTIEARARRKIPESKKLSNAATSKNARAYLKLRGQGVPEAVLQDAGLATPLLDTRQLFTAVTYVVRK